MNNFNKYLKNKLMNDIINELKNDIINDDIINEDLNCDKERYERIITEITCNYFKDNEIIFEGLKRNKKEKEKCLARIWNDGYGNCQCKSHISTDNKLCLIHEKLFKKDNLWLGFITEPRPINPKKGNKIKQWND